MTGARSFAGVMPRAGLNRFVELGLIMPSDRALVLSFSANILVGNGPKYQAFWSYTGELIGAGHSTN